MAWLEVRISIRKEGQAVLKTQDLAHLGAQLSSLARVNVLIVADYPLKKE